MKLPVLEDGFWVEKLEDGSRVVHSQESSEEEYLGALFTINFNFCGCGNPEIAFEYVRDMLEWVNSKDYHHDMSGAELFFMYWADSHELTEHGSSVNGCWLTEDGKKLLEILKEYT